MRGRKGQQERRRPTYRPRRIRNDLEFDHAWLDCSCLCQFEINWQSQSECQISIVSTVMLQIDQCNFHCLHYNQGRYRSKIKLPLSTSIFHVHTLTLDLFLATDSLHQEWLDSGCLPVKRPRGGGLGSAELTTSCRGSTTNVKIQTLNFSAVTRLNTYARCLGNPICMRISSAVLFRWIVASWPWIERCFLGGRLMVRVAISAGWLGSTDRRARSRPVFCRGGGRRQFTQCSLPLLALPTFQRIARPVGATAF